jgi:WD40 repeat protein
MVVNLAFSPDGRFLAGACLDGTVRVWDVHEDGAPRVLRGHSGHVNAVALSPDGK